MKSAKIAIGIAAAMAVTSVGFEARAQFITQDECDRAALAAYNRGVREAKTKKGLSYWYKLYQVQLQYDADMAICDKIPPSAAPPPGKKPAQFPGKPLNP